MLQVVLTQALNRADKGRTGVAGRIAAWGQARLQAYRGHRRYRATVHTLHALDDRTLHDIGVHRSEIESYASVGGAGRFPDRFEVHDHLFSRG